MARIGFVLAASASVVFALWFLAMELESPGLSFAIAHIGMPLIATIFGFTKTTRTDITEDGKGAGWAAVIIAVLGVAYIATFFGSWLIVSLIWLGLHIPMVIGLIASPSSRG